MPETLDTSGGVRQQRASRLRAEMEAQRQAGAQPQAQPAAATGAQPVAEQSQTAGSGPIGQGEHVVKQGECISSIAKDTGHFWETIWNEPANSELKGIRKDPNVLLPGDRLTIPVLRPKQEPGATEMRHRFVRRGEPAKLCLRLLDTDQPLAGLPYKLTIGDRVCTGTTDAEGKLEIPIPGNAKSGRLEVGKDDDIRTYHLRLGSVDPVESITGVQQRLNNLGFACGAADGVLGPRTRAALKRYQARHNPPEPGEPDVSTQKQLQSDHGS